MVTVLRHVLNKFVTQDLTLATECIFLVKGQGLAIGAVRLNNSKRPLLHRLSFFQEVIRNVLPNLQSVLQDWSDITSVDS